MWSEWAGVTRIRHRQRVVSAEAVDPGIHLGLGRVVAGSDGGIGFGNPLGLPGKASLPLGRGLDVLGNGGGLGHGVNIGHRRAIL